MGAQLTLLQNTDVDLSHNNVDAGHRDPKSCPPGDTNPSKDYFCDTVRSHISIVKFFLTLLLCFITCMNVLLTYMYTMCLVVM